MSSSIVQIGAAHINTTVTRKEGDIKLLVKTFLSNNKNNKKIIGLDTEMAQKARKQNKTALLELCDGDHCLIVQLPEDEDVPVSLFNFLNLPDYTFVGIGIHKTLMKLETEFGLTCKNVVDVGPATGNLTNKTDYQKGMITFIVSNQMQTSAIFAEWDKFVLNKNQIKLAASNAYFAFAIGNTLLNGFGF